MFEIMSVRTLLLMSLGLISWQPLMADSSDYAYEKFDVKNLSQPAKLDCEHTHGRFLAAINPNTQGEIGNDKGRSYRVTQEDYLIPDVSLTSEEGVTMSVRDVLNSDKPVMLNFIFTTCTTICPVLSASFSQVQDAMGSEVEDISMISISIDPEYDTVEKLSAYAQRFEAGKQWQFLTGQLDDVIAVERAFDIFRGSKMNHEPVTLIRVSKDQSWLRIDGLANAGDIVSEYRNLLSNDN
jgi:protein SCO1/2